MKGGSPMKLYSTPLSHFSRKVRAVADFYELDIEYIDVGNVAEIGIEKYAGNPLMGVPVLEGENLWLVDSDHIIAYLARMYDSADRLRVHSTKMDDLNIRAVLNGLMSSEVRIILGKRSGIPIDEFRFFDKAKQSIAESLKWLEARAERFDPKNISMNEIHLVCALDHLRYLELVDLKPFPKLLDLSEAIGAHPAILRSSPFVLKPKPR